MKAFIEHSFHAVADLSAEERERYFVEHEIEAKTRAEVCALLTFNSNTSSSLHREIGVVGSGRSLVWIRKIFRVAIPL